MIWIFTKWLASHVLSSLHMFSNFTIVLGKRYMFTPFYSWGNWGLGKLSNLLPNQYILNSDSGYMSLKPLHLSKILDVESRGQGPLPLTSCVAFAKTQLFLTCGELAYSWSIQGRPKARKKWGGRSSWTRARGMILLWTCSPGLVVSSHRFGGVYRSGDLEHH